MVEVLRTWNKQATGASRTFFTNVNFQKLRNAGGYRNFASLILSGEKTFEKCVYTLVLRHSEALRFQILRELNF